MCAGQTWKEKALAAGASLGQAALPLGQRELPEEPQGQDSVLSWGAGLAGGLQAAWRGDLLSMPARETLSLASIFSISC